MFECSSCLLVVTGHPNVVIMFLNKHDEVDGTIVVVTVIFITTTMMMIIIASNVLLWIH